MPLNACLSATEELAPKVSFRAPAEVGRAIGDGFCHPAADVGRNPPTEVLPLEDGLFEVASKAKAVASLILRSRSTGP